MGKKRRNYPDLEQLLTRPWCYYCERDFEDLKLLISHQKAKHYKCDRCGRRLNTAGGLSVHMNQVHKETLSHVENAIEGREGLDVEIFGMEGVPEEAVARHTQEIMQTFQKDRANRQAVTGNPPPGTQRPLKKLKIESAQELKRRLAEYRAQEGARKSAETAKHQTTTTSATASPSSAAAVTSSGAGLPANGHGHGLPLPPSFGQPFGGAGGISLPNRPPGGGAPGVPGLPQRPSAFTAPPPGISMGTGSASTLDDLVAGASQQQGNSAGDDIDKLIRMAEAGIRPGATPTTPGSAATAAPPSAHDKEKSKKEKATRMIYGDGDFSVEEKMGFEPRFAVAV